MKPLSLFLGASLLFQLKLILIASVRFRYWAVPVALRYRKVLLPRRRTHYRNASPRDNESETQK